LGKKEMVTFNYANRTVKIIEGSYKKNIDIKKYINLELPHHMYENGIISNMDAFSKLISESFLKNGIKAKKCRMCFNASNIILRTFELPTQKDRDIPQILDFEISENLPILINDYVMEYQVVKRYTKDNISFSKVLVALVPKKIVSQFHTLAQRLQLQPELLDLNSNAHDILYFKFIPKIEGIQAFMDIGFDLTHISIYQNGEWSFSKTLDIGVSDLYFKVANAYNIELFDAEKRLESIEFSYSNEKSEIQVLVEEGIDDLITEVSRAFRYYTSQNSEWVVEKITLLGGVHQMDILINKLEKSFEAKIDTFTEAFTPILSDFIDENKDFSIDLYANAMGLLCR